MEGGREGGREGRKEEGREREGGAKFAEQSENR